MLTLTLVLWPLDAKNWLIWCCERLKTRGKGDDRGWDGWMASPTQWTWVWIGDGQEGLACCSPWGHKELDITNWTGLNWTYPHLASLGAQRGSVCLQCGRPGFDPLVGKIPWKRKWQPTPVFLPEEPHGWRSLVGCSPQVHKQSGVTEWLHSLHSYTLSGLKSTLLCPAPTLEDSKK